MPLALLITIQSGIVALAVLGFWVWMLVECASREPRGNNRLAWLLVIFFGQVIGALVYFLVRRRARTRAFGR